MAATIPDIKLLNEDFVADQIIRITKDSTSLPVITALGISFILMCEKVKMDPVQCLKLLILQRPSDGWEGGTHD